MMKRRNFTQSIVAGIGISSLPLGVSLASKSKSSLFEKQEQIKTSEGLKLKLNQQVHPTNNQDRKQFILTFDIEGKTSSLQEKIYELKMANGESQKVFMTPVNENQLQAVFNRRLNA